MRDILRFLFVFELVNNDRAGQLPRYLLCHGSLVIVQSPWWGVASLRSDALGGSGEIMVNGGGSIDFDAYGPTWIKRMTWRVDRNNSSDKHLYKYTGKTWKY
jgi:hypothetical protein